MIFIRLPIFSYCREGHSLQKKKVHNPSPKPWSVSPALSILTQRCISLLVVSLLCRWFLTHRCISTLLFCKQKLNVSFFSVSQDPCKDTRRARSLQIQKIRNRTVRGRSISVAARRSSMDLGHPAFPARARTKIPFVPKKARVSLPLRETSKFANFVHIHFKGRLRGALIPLCGLMFIVGRKRKKVVLIQNFESYWANLISLFFAVLKWSAGSLFWIWIQKILTRWDCLHTHILYLLISFTCSPQISSSSVTSSSGDSEPSLLWLFDRCHQQVDARTNVCSVETQQDGSLNPIRCHCVKMCELLNNKKIVTVVRRIPFFDWIRVGTF